MKNPVYFPISTTHYSSTLSLNIRRTKGWAGYGQYLAILQMLAHSKTRRLSIEEVPDIAFNLHITEEEVLNIVTSYFVIEGQVFYSSELEEALSYFDAKYNASSNGGKKAAANMTPEERLDRSNKANMAKKQKLNQLDTDLSSKVDNLSNHLTTKEIPNNKTKEYRIEENGKENGKKEYEREQEQIKENETEQVLQFSLEDENLKSIYLGENLNKKLVTVYLSQSNELKTKLVSYHIFELLILYKILDIHSDKLKANVFNRNMLISILNEKFDATIQSALLKFNDTDIQYIKENEEGCIKALQFLRL